MVHAADGTPHDLIQQIFPNCIVHSDPTETYNCFTWAIHEEKAINSEIKNRPWWPNRIDSYWPDPKAEDTIETFIAFFAELEYEICEDDAFETGFCKIAVYVDSNQFPYHLSRQIVSGENSGFWTSKCGASHDVLHRKLEDMAGNEDEGRYGTVSLIMKKRI